MGVPYPTYWKNEGKNLGRKHPELSEKSGGYLLVKSDGGKRVERKSARKDVTHNNS